MDLGSLLFISGILILVILFIGQPLVRRKSSGMAGDGQKSSALLAERERIITDLIELDFDYNMGKIPKEDYPDQRQQLLSSGARVMQQLDAFQAVDGGLGSGFTTEADAAHRGAGLTGSPARKERSGKRPLKTPDDDLEVLLAARRRERGEKAGGFCPQCGSPVQQSDRFCPRCGESISSTGKTKK